MHSFIMARKKGFFQQQRSRLLWVHRWLGLISGIVVFIVAITGCLYVFEEELRDVFQHKYLYVQAPVGATRQPLSAVIAVVNRQYPAEKITQVRFREKKEAAIICYTRSEKAISVDPYRLQVTGVRNLKTDFFNVVLDMHRHLCWGNTGSEIIRWNVLIFFILCVSGLVLWWPKQKRFFRQAVTIRFSTKNKKRLTWDLHSVLGFYALLVLLIISLTGIFWMFDWAKDAVRYVTGSLAQKEQKARSVPVTGMLPAFSLEEAYAIASEKYPGAQQVILSDNPADSTAPVRVLLRYPYTIVRKQNTLFFDKYSGRLLREDLAVNNTGYDKVARSNYQLHTGNIPALGIGSKIIYFLASLFAASLPVTGCLIWLGRKKKKGKKPAGIAAKARPATVPVT